jgi:hypothetical protein
MDSDHQGMFDQLKGKSGKDFDPTGAMTSGRGRVGVPTALGFAGAYGLPDAVSAGKSLKRRSSHSV